MRAALDKKATDVVVLDLRHTPAFTDFFVLCSGQNTRQVKAIADSVEDTLRAASVRPAHVEGYERADWILMDFFTFIVHVFTPQTRDFYALERLWGDAERIEMKDEPPEEQTEERAARSASAQLKLPLFSLRLCNVALPFTRRGRPRRGAPRAGVRGLRHVPLAALARPGLRRLLERRRALHAAALPPVRRPTSVLAGVGR